MAWFSRTSMIHSHTLVLSLTMIHSGHSGSLLCPDSFRADGSLSLTLIHSAVMVLSVLMIHSRVMVLSVRMIRSVSVVLSAVLTHSIYVGPLIPMVRSVILALSLDLAYKGIEALTDAGKPWRLRLNPLGLHRHQQHQFPRQA